MIVKFHLVYAKKIRLRGRARENRPHLGWVKNIILRDIGRENRPEVLLKLFMVSKDS